MTNLKLPNMSYEGLCALLEGSEGEAKKIAYATHARMNTDKSVDVYHHGNPIATVEGHRVTITNAGYHTKTTAHRLNTITQAGGYGRVYIRDFRMRVQVTEGLECIVQYGPYGFSEGEEHEMDGLVTIYN